KKLHTYTLSACKLSERLALNPRNRSNRKLAPTLLSPEIKPTTGRPHDRPFLLHGLQALPQRLARGLQEPKKLLSAPIRREGGLGLAGLLEDGDRCKAELRRGRPRALHAWHQAERRRAAFFPELSPLESGRDR